MRGLVTARKERSFVCVCVCVCVSSQILVALITIDVHNRDIVEHLATTHVSSKADFGWQMQLRYEWDAETEQVMICQVNARCVCVCVRWFTVVTRAVCLSGVCPCVLLHCMVETL